MNAVGRNLRELIESRDLKQSALAVIAGVSEGSVSGWLSGRSYPRTKPLERIAEYYGVSMDDLVSESAGLYAKAHGLTEAPPNAIAPSEPQRAYAPLYGRVHAGGAGEPDLLDDSIPTPYEVLERHPRGYWLEVEGDCMDRVYPDGCHIFIDPEMPPRDGSIAVVSIDGGDYVMRRLKRGASTILLSPESHNASWEDILIAGDREVRMVGTVVWFQSGREMP